MELETLLTQAQEEKAAYIYIKRRSEGATVHFGRGVSLPLVTGMTPGEADALLTELATTSPPTETTPISAGSIAPLNWMRISSLGGWELVVLRI